jgi:MFS family permease
LADILGRKTPIVLSTSLCALFGTMQAYAPNIGFLVVIRIITGLFIGFFGPIGATLTAEITPRDNRGKLMSLVGLSLSIG